MAIVLAGFTMSLDGFIANPDDRTEGLFDWFDNGDTEVVFPDGKFTVHVSPPTAMVLRDIARTTGAFVTGRRMFDLAHGWGGCHPLNPNVRTLGEQAEHIVRGRALWVHKVVDDPSLEPMMNWDEPDDPPRSVAEVVAGLQHTWQILRAYIEPYTRDDPDAGSVLEQERDGLRTVWGMLDHDLCHAGELALMLGVLDLETPEF